MIIFWQRLACFVCQWQARLLTQAHISARQAVQAQALPRQGYNSLQKTGGRTAAGGGAAFPSAASARLRALVGPNHPEAQSLRGEPAGANSFEALAFKVRPGTLTF